MRVLSIDIENFLSIESAHLDFQDSGLVLVEGWNHDTGRANGAGKTAIFNALSYGVFGKLPRKVTATEIQRRGSRSASVKVTLRARDGSLVSIRRSRPSGLEFFQDDVAQTWSQEEWEKKIGVSYGQFLITMYCAQSTAGRFLSLNDKEKKDFILQLLDLNEFTVSKEFTDEAIDNLLKAVASLEVSISSNRAKIQAYEESLINELDAQELLAGLQAKITSTTNEIKGLQDIAKPDLSKYARLQKEIDDKRTEFAVIKQRRAMLHEQYKKSWAKITPFKGEDVCTNCGTELDTSHARNLHDQRCADLKTEAVAAKTAIDDCDILLSKESQVETLSKRLREKLSQETSVFDAAQNRVKELANFLATQQMKVKDAVVKLDNNSKLLSKIQALRLESETTVNDIANNKREIELYRTISAAYSTTGAQAYVLDTVVDSFNIRMEHYVSLIWPNAAYKLLSYKENAKGDIVAKFSESLTMDGQEVSIGSLSGGEARALSICADFAIIDIMNAEFGLSMNPIILDEPFNDLDAVGREFIVDILEQIAQDRQIFVVDHASEAKAMFSKIIRIEKRSGVSSLHLDS